MAPGGAWYNDRLKGLIVCAVVVGVVVVVAVVYLDKNYNFASHVTFAG